MGTSHIKKSGVGCATVFLLKIAEIDKIWEIEIVPFDRTSRPKKTFNEPFRSIAIFLQNNRVSRTAITFIISASFQNFKFKPGSAEAV